MIRSYVYYHPSVARDPGRFYLEAMRRLRARRRAVQTTEGRDAI